MDDPYIRAFNVGLILGAITFSVCFCAYHRFASGLFTGLVIGAFVGALAGLTRSAFWGAVVFTISFYIIWAVVNLTDPLFEQEKVADVPLWAVGILTVVGAITGKIAKEVTRV